MKKITCIIPAYNEARRIAQVLQLAATHPLIDEVIVVDDGSTDETGDIARNFERVRVIVLPKNHWKSAAVHVGLLATGGEYILLLDADLIGLTMDDISHLIYPILDDEADITISLRKGTAPVCYLLGIDYTSGERIFPRRMIDQKSMDELGRLPGFWLEVFLNTLIIRNRFRIKVVRWNNALSTLKWIKRGLWSGTLWEIGMRMDIYRTIGISKIVSQIADMRRLMVIGRRLNFEYLELYKEIPLFLILPFHKWFLAHGKKISEQNSVLITDATLLIGEFVASIPAISSYVRNHPDFHVDIVVARTMVPLARKIRGIRKVFTVDSFLSQETSIIQTYDQVFALRINDGAYQALLVIQTEHLHTGVSCFVRYIPHLLWSLYRRKTPTQWREINFLMLGEEPHVSTFEEIFTFDDTERNRVLAIPEMQTGKKRVIVHTGTNWIMKQWENGKWIELLNRLNSEMDATFIFIGAKGDLSDYERISDGLHFQPQSLIGKVDLAELALILRASDYFIGIDSGPGNLAQLCDTSSVHIMGAGPHMYRPSNETRHVVIDKTNGRGLIEMFISMENSFIHSIRTDEVQRAFESIR